MDHKEFYRSYSLYSNYLLTINGFVRTPILFSMQEINLPSKKIKVVLECSGDKRELFKPKVYGEQWRKGAISQEYWKGKAFNQRYFLELEWIIFRKLKSVWIMGKTGQKQDSSSNIKEVIDGLLGHTNGSFGKNGLYNLHTKIRKAQRVVLGIEYVYYFYNEDTTHHFHTWYVPRYEWMYELGRSVESVRPVLLHARNKMNNDDHKQKVLQAIDALKKELNRSSSKYFNVFCIFNTIDNTGHHQAQVRLGPIYYLVLQFALNHIGHGFNPAMRVKIKRTFFKKILCEKKERIRLLHFLGI